MTPVGSSFGIISNTLFAIIRRAGSRVAVSLLLALVAAPCLAGPAPAGYVQSLVARAHSQQLAASAEWRALLHYQPNWMRAGVASTVTSDWFFLAARGRVDPAAELDATLAALFSDTRIAARDAKPAGCVFVARRKFLVRRLDIDTWRMPEQQCPEYKRWRRTLSPEKISLIFPTAFPNSPSSMFGHTLLRIDSARRRHGTELLSFAVNFAAAAGDDAHGLGFAYKGLTGGYPGIFGVFPYYKKVKQYAWIEHRDIWSYPLELKPAEIDRLVDHLWEMDDVRFAYYFLIKNCSYQLLSLIEVARPSLRLTQRYSWYAIPADTIRTVADIDGLLGEPRYRASLETVLRWQASQLTASQRQLAAGVAANDIGLDSPRLQALAATERAAVLEVAHDYLYYQLQSSHAQAEAGRAHADAILRARSRIHQRSPFGPVPRPATPPDNSHPTLRVAASTVYATDTLSLGARLRPAYHDLLDAPGGYTEGAQINFMDIGLRLGLDQPRLRLSDVKFLNITSLSPRDDLFQPVSFTLDTGLRRRPSSRVFADVRNSLGYYIQGGPGLAWGGDDLLGYVFGLGSLDANAALQPGYALGAGARAGVLAHEAPGYQLQLEAGSIEYVAGDGGYNRWIRLAQQIPVARDFALRGALDWQDSPVNTGLRTIVSVRAYF